MRIVALVPIKLNSQRLPNKNLLPIGNRPLCWYICNSMLAVEMIDDIYVYCSDLSIKEYIPKGVKILQRPMKLDEDNVKGFEIYKEFISCVEADIYVLAHTTSPFISSNTIEDALLHVTTEGYDSAFTATKIQTFAWYESKPLNYVLDDVPRTQDIEPVWIETSGFYIFRREVFQNLGQRIGNNPFIQEVRGMEAIDIDTKDDFDLACAMFNAKGDLLL